MQEVKKQINATKYYATFLVPKKKGLDANLPYEINNYLSLHTPKIGFSKFSWQPVEARVDNCQHSHLSTSWQFIYTLLATV